MAENAVDAIAITLVPGPVCRMGDEPVYASCSGRETAGQNQEHRNKKATLRAAFDNIIPGRPVARLEMARQFDPLVSV